MQAGLLRDIITIEKSAIVRDDTGGQNLIWTSFWRGRAEVKQSKGSQVVRNGEVYNTVTKQVTVRTKPRFSVKDMRLDIAGQKYRILSMDVRVRDMATVFICELINE